MLLLRTHRFAAREAAFARTLQDESGYRVAVVADERRGVLDTQDWPKVSLSRPALAALGLHAPQDVGWRCGDYGLYLARARFPATRHFWLVEPDVRSTFADWGALLHPFEASPDADVILSGVRLSSTDHFWHPTMRQHTAAVYQAIFAFGRFSARALDVCLAGRQRDRHTLWARLLWPNDEAFVTTTAALAGLSVRDINDFGRLLCTPDTFDFLPPHRGEALAQESAEPRVFHPVLWGDEFGRKQARHGHGIKWHEAMRLKLLRGVLMKRYHRYLGLGRLIPAPPPAGG